MKKKFDFKVILIAIMAFVMLFAFVACGDDKKPPSDDITVGQFFDKLWTAAKAIGKDPIADTDDIKVSIAGSLGLKSSKMNYLLTLDLDLVLDRQTANSENSAIKLAVGEKNYKQAGASGNILTVWYFLNDPTTLYLQLLDSKYTMYFDLSGQKNAIEDENDDGVKLGTYTELGEWLLDWMNGDAIFKEKNLMSIIKIFTDKFGPNWSLNDFVLDGANFLGLDIVELLGKLLDTLVPGTSLSGDDGTTDLLPVIKKFGGLFIDEESIEFSKATNTYSANLSELVTGALNSMIAKIFSKTAKLSFTVDNNGGIAGLNFFLKTAVIDKAVGALDIDLTISEITIAPTTATTDTTILGKTVAAGLEEFADDFSDYTMTSNTVIDLTKLKPVVLSFDTFWLDFLNKEDAEAAESAHDYESTTPFVDMANNVAINGYMEVEIKGSASLVRHASALDRNGVDANITIKYGPNKANMVIVAEACLVTVAGATGEPSKTRFDVKVTTGNLENDNEAFVNAVVGYVYAALQYIFLPKADGGYTNTAAGVNQIWADAYVAFLSDGISQISVVTTDFSDAFYTAVWDFGSWVMDSYITPIFDYKAPEVDPEVGDMVGTFSIPNILNAVLKSAGAYTSTSADYAALESTYGIKGVGLDVSITDLLGLLFDTSAAKGYKFGAKSIISYQQITAIDANGKVTTKATTSATKPANATKGSQDYTVLDMINDTIAGNVDVPGVTMLINLLMDVLKGSWNMDNNAAPQPLDDILTGNPAQTLINMIEKADIRLIVCVDAPTNALSIYVKYSSSNISAAADNTAVVAIVNKGTAGRYTGKNITFDTTKDILEFTFEGYALAEKEVA